MSGDQELLAFGACIPQGPNPLLRTQSNMFRLEADLLGVCWHGIQFATTSFTFQQVAMNKGAPLFRHWGSRHLQLLSPTVS